MKTSSASALMKIAVAANTTANATRTSVSILPKRPAQLVILELLLTLMHVAQLLNAAKLRLFQQLLLPPQPPPLQSLILQSPISQLLLQLQFVLILKAVSDAMVKAGLFHLNHAQSTLAMLLTISELLSEIVVTHVFHARKPKLRSLMSLMSAVASTHVNQPAAK